MKKILIVTRGFYPVIAPRSFRATELAKELVRQGNEVHVLHQNNGIKSMDFEVEFGVKLFQYSHKPKTGGPKLSLIAKLSNRIKEQFFDLPDFKLRNIIYKTLVEEFDSYDVLITVATPHSIHWGAAKAIRKRKFHCGTWIADCGDPYMGATNMQFNRPFYFRYFERDFCKQANYISVPFQGALEGYESKFHDKIKVIPQGFNFEEVRACRENPAFGKDVLVIGYAGSLVPNRRDPSELLDYLISEGVNFKFVCFCKNGKLISKYQQKHPEKVVIREYINRLELLSIFKSFKFVLNFENQGTTQLPSKLIDYSIIGKPILSIKVGELNTHKVNQFLAGNYDSQEFIGQLDSYRIENVARSFISLT